MFNQISMWQMVVDFSLVTAILIMAFKAMKTSRIQAIIAQVAELEKRIQTLIAEAEGSAKHLNDQLLRREQNLHKYSGELEKYEKEISLSVVEGESLTKELALLCESARRETEELRSSLSEASEARHERSAASVESRRTAHNSRNQKRYDYETEEQEDEDDYLPSDESFTTRTSSRRASEWLEAPETPRVEVEAEQPRRSSMQNLQQLYDTAETMLKRGQQPKDVSQKTKLPFDRVQRLAQMIEIEREEQRDKTRMGAPRVEKDARLGALGATRRPSTAM